MPGSGVHFWGVGFGAVLATAAALALTIVGWRRNDARTVLVGTAFSVMAALLALHGLATPGVIMGYEGGLGAFTGGATLLLGAAVLALAALPTMNEPQSVNRLVVLQVILIVAIAMLGAVGMLVPSVVPNVPEAGGPLALSLLAVGLLLYAFLGVRAINTYLLTRRRADLWSSSASPSSRPRSSPLSSSTTCSSGGGSATPSSSSASPSSEFRSPST